MDDLAFWLGIPDLFATVCCPDLNLITIHFLLLSGKNLTFEDLNLLMKWAL